MSRDDLVQRLRTFRLAVEQEAQTQAVDVQTPLALVLFDLAAWLGLDEEEQIAVLGVDNALRLRQDYGIEFEI